MTGTTWNQEPRIFEGAGAIAKLLALGLTHESVVMAIGNSEIERLGCSVFEPRLMPGIKAWGAAFGTLAEESIRTGRWEKVEEHNLPRILNEELHVAVAVISGDDGTGLTHRIPKSKSPRGVQTVSFVRFNHWQGVLFPDLSVPEAEDSYVTYWLLIYSDGKGALRAEVSLPMGIDSESRLCAWKERILIGIPGPDAVGRKIPEDEEPLDVEVIVKPKS